MVRGVAVVTAAAAGCDDARGCEARGVAVLCEFMVRFRAEIKFE